MTVEVVDLRSDELRSSREAVLDHISLSEAELRERVVGEIATSEEQAALARLEEIAFLLGEDE